MVCAKCGAENAPNVCSRCEKRNYCSRKCQVADWKQHKRSCSSKVKVQLPASTSTARFACPECHAKKWPECMCEDRPTCWVCLESEGGELLRGCSCRGSAGYVHASCIVELNKRRKERQDECPTCNQRFVGALLMTVVEARASDAQAGQHFDGDAVSDLARAYAEQGRLADALRLFRQVLDRAIVAFGADSEVVANTQINVANVLTNQGKLEEALSLFNRALKTQERRHGPGSAAVSEIKANLANALARAGKTGEALLMYTAALSVLNQTDSERNEPTVTAIQRSVAGLYMKEGHFAEALKRYSAALVTVVKVHGPDHPVTAQLRRELSSCQRLQLLYRCTVGGMALCVVLLAYWCHIGILVLLFPLGRAAA